jgi:hypothetical protein
MKSIMYRDQKEWTPDGVGILCAENPMHVQPPFGFLPNAQPLDIQVSAWFGSV